MAARALMAALALCLAAPAAAQESAPETPEAAIPQMPVVVLDRDALFANSRFGQRVRADIEAASSALVAENRRIEAMLEAEERALTERRATEDSDAFRTLASDFDARVEGIRSAQDAKARAIQNQTERAQQVFLDRTGPVLRGLAGEVGALVILDRRMVIAASGQVDITDIALERIDAALGDGAELEAAPVPRPDDEGDVPVGGRLQVAPRADPAAPDADTDAPNATPDPAPDR